MYTKDYKCPEAIRQELTVPPSRYPSTQYFDWSQSESSALSLSHCLSLSRSLSLSFLPILSCACKHSHKQQFSVHMEVQWCTSIFIHRSEVSQTCPVVCGFARQYSSSIFWQNLWNSGIINCLRKALAMRTIFSATDLKTNAQNSRTTLLPTNQCKSHNITLTHPPTHTQRHQVNY